MMKRMLKLYRDNAADPKLGPMIAVSTVFHVIFLLAFMFMPARSTADVEPDYDIQQVDLVYSEEIGGGGTWGKPKRGPAHDGKIVVPPKSDPVQIPSESTDTAKVNKKDEKKPDKKKLKGSSDDTPEISDPLRAAIDAMNEGREGEYTRPDGDPNSKNPGPSGPPGGDICADYKRRAGRQIRRSGSVPEAAGKSTTIRIVIGSGGGVASKRVVKSSGIPHADGVALSLVPGSFGAPPEGCGSVPLTVRVRFRGGGSDVTKSDDTSSSRKRSRRERTYEKKPRTRRDRTIDRALDDL